MVVEVVSVVEGAALVVVVEVVLVASVEPVVAVLGWSDGLVSGLVLGVDPLLLGTVVAGRVDTGVMGFVLTGGAVVVGAGG